MEVGVKSFGSQILDGIIKNSLVRAECEGLCVWAENSPEVLEAIALNALPNRNKEIKEILDSYEHAFGPLRDRAILEQLLTEHPE